MMTRRIAWGSCAICVLAHMQYVKQWKGRFKGEIMEEWKPVRGFEEYYEVSNWGKIRSLDRTIVFKDGRKRKFYGKILTISAQNNSGYNTVGLHIKGKSKTFLLHRIVAEAFVPNPLGLDEVNHKDENKRNNTASNLEWCTHAENVNHGNEIERGADKQRRSFRQLDLNGNLIRVWKGFKQMQRETGFQRKSVYDCCVGKRGSYKGYKWEYEVV